MKLSMIVVTISLTPRRALSEAGMIATSAPAAAPAASGTMKLTGEWPETGKFTATSTAISAPSRSWPSPPRLNSPARYGTATPMPTRRSGVAASSRKPKSKLEPKEASTRSR